MNAASGTIGPGRLIVLVGPSGAGKDTLLAGLRLRFADNPSFVFPRRVVTRPSSDFEEHDSLSPELFQKAIAEGAFAFWWDAHGNSYGIPRRIDDDIRAGRSVICNVSRTIVERLRASYSHVLVVLVTAPAATLADRIQSRQRTGDGSVSQRLSRNEAVGYVSADCVVNNCRTIADGVDVLAKAVTNSAPGDVRIRNPSNLEDGGAAAASLWPPPRTD